MKVYEEEEGGFRLVGRADVPDDGGPAYEVRLFGPTSMMVEVFTIGAVTTFPAGTGLPHVSRGILLGPGQRPELLPGWQPLSS